MTLPSLCEPAVAKHHRYIYATLSLGLTSSTLRRRSRNLPCLFSKNSILRAFFFKEIKGIQIGKEEVKLSLFADDMIMYIENHRLHQKMEVKNLYSENYKTLKKEIQEDTNKWKHVPCSWVGRIKSSKCPYYPKQFIDSMQSLLKYQWHISQI